MDRKCCFLFILSAGLHVTMTTGLRLQPVGSKQKNLFHALTSLLVDPNFGTCYRNKKDENMMRLPNGENICRDRGRNYMVSETWFDESSCRICFCMAPFHVECCQAKLVPKNMPNACEVDPAGRQSTILPIRQCMAPLAVKQTLGRRVKSQPCRDRDLQEALSGTVITHGKPGTHYRLVAFKPKETNSRRHSGDRPRNRRIRLLISSSVHSDWIWRMLKSIP